MRVIHITARHEMLLMHCWCQRQAVAHRARRRAPATNAAAARPSCGFRPPGGRDRGPPGRARARAPPPLCSPPFPNLCVAPQVDLTDLTDFE